MSEVLNEQGDDSTSLMGPGAQLRIARESNRLSVQDVARYLHLKPDVIQDIENDDYSRAPRIVFLRGYIRSYAKLMGLPGDDIIQSLDKFYQEEVPYDPLIRERSRSIPLDSNKWVRLFSALVVLSLLVGLTVWWHTQKDTSTSKATKPSAALISKKQSAPVENKVAEKSKTDSTEKPLAVQAEKNETVRLPVALKVKKLNRDLKDDIKVADAQEISDDEDDTI